MVHWAIPLVAILVIGGMETTAVIKGVDGALFSVAIAAIAGIAGYAIPRRLRGE